MFEIGQKVICVDDSFPESVRNYLRELPKKGTVYTVRDIIPAQGWDKRETCAVLLREVANPAPPHKKEWGECGFAPHRFAEVEPVKESVSATQQQTFTFTSGQPVHINCRCTITKP